MNNASTIEKVIEAENAAKAHVKDLKSKKESFEKETLTLIEEMRRDGYEKANAEIENEKHAFEKVQAERIASEKQKCAAVNKSLSEKKNGSLENIVKRCFDEITGEQR